MIIFRSDEKPQHQLFDAENHDNMSGILSVNFSGSWLFFSAAERVNLTGWHTIFDALINRYGPYGNIKSSPKNGSCAQVERIAGTPAVQ